MPASSGCQRGASPEPDPSLYHTLVLSEPEGILAGLLTKEEQSRKGDPHEGRPQVHKGEAPSICIKSRAGIGRAGTGQGR